MRSFTAKEATKFFHSYELKCNENLVQEWMNRKSTKHIGSQVTEDDVWEFTEWWGRKDTAYEEGIDDQTKINRLLEEITRLKKEKSSLEKEKTDLELQLGIMPF
ncbi:hypothetical protein GCM10007063_34930 [Lentibacillus kapialis]|uniref:Uncharacterized protein n=1 Tax=Lentibacillus kapialis TaxID=340214 RepID=A0A917Q4Z9_9BACI|nr:hypothetical protein [Lentibacillus kapialis]GGK09462.1 hypothetical protein GCM10007063_34930 [Lentibacillus kapialis]